MTHPYTQAIEVFEKDIARINREFYDLDELSQSQGVYIIARDSAIERRLWAIDLLHKAYKEQE